MRTTTRKRKTSTPARALADPGPNRGSTWTLRRAGALGVLEAPALAELDWLVHGFSTRSAGVAPLEEPANPRKPRRGLNLGFTDEDSPEQVRENRRRFSESLGAAKMCMVTLRQMHSDIVHRVDAGNSGRDQELLKGDALSTREPGLLLAVETADCIPILLADTRTHAIAAIHSGWRGTVARIAEKTLGRMRMEFGTRPEDVIAALGPGIGGCCYEVGHPVVKEFAAGFPNAREWFEGPFDRVAAGESELSGLPWLTTTPPGHGSEPPRVHLDLIAANRAILAAAGLRREKISSSGFCTACRTDLFFSYRRERNTGRLMAAIGIL